MTELVTGLGMLGFSCVEEALAARPPEMVSVSPETWALLERARRGGALDTEFDAAFANGRAFLAATDGLRGRHPVVVEWKGSHRAPGDEVAPVDLRVDHVFLVSCKYLSKITINASPFHLFERLLQGGHGVRSGDWYSHVARAEHQQLYESIRKELDLYELPDDVSELAASERRRVSVALSTGWPSGSAELHKEFVERVASETASRWQQSTETASGAEALLWRMLRMGSAPYFVLGASASSPIRLRIATPWDWRLEFRLRGFECVAQHGGQPRVGWVASVEDRHSGATRDVLGHVEIRWSHGRFMGNPEAKVYLDTPHSDVPGYFPLV